MVLRVILGQPELTNYFNFKFCCAKVFLKCLRTWFCSWGQSSFPKCNLILGQPRTDLKLFLKLACIRSGFVLYLGTNYLLVGTVLYLVRENGERVSGEVAV
jgi:hypothetical protein